jgi:hypothetical protein
MPERGEFFIYFSGMGFANFQDVEKRRKIKGKNFNCSNWNKLFSQHLL